MPNAIARVRPVAAGAVLCTLLSLAVVTFSIRTAPIITDSDFAVTELYVELATRGELLVGPYSRFGWHHPGPLYFYVIAPLYAFSGHRAATLYGGAAAINFVAVLALAYVLARESRLLATTVLVACAAFAWRVPRFLASPWTAHVPVLSSLAFIALAASVMSGRIQMLPWMIVFGSFAAQTHVGLVPLVVVVSTGAVLSIAWNRAADATRTRSIIASAVIAVMLWLPTILEGLLHHGGNLAALWRFFIIDAYPGHSLREAITNGSYGLMAMFRPDFELPWGGHFSIDYLSWTIFGAAAESVLLCVVGSWHVAHNRRLEAHVTFIALAATAIGVLGLMRVRDDILNHDLFRVAAIGAFNVGVLAAAGVRAIGSALEFRPVRLSGSLIVVVFVVIVMALLTVRDVQSLTAYERRQTGRAAMVAAYDAVHEYLTRSGVRKLLLQIGADRWGDAAGMLLRLVQDGTPVAVKDDEAMFTDHFRPRGDEDALITLADLGLHRVLRDNPGNTVLLEAFPLFVDACRIPR
jgi:hypothetical protein